MYVYDICIVGAGIIGLATARALLREAPDLRLLVLEKESRVAQHQTGHNSGVLHTGVYYSPGSLKASYCREGRSQMLAFCEEEGVPHRVTGKVIVATSEEETVRLSSLKERAEQNGVPVQALDRKELAEIEPHAAGLSALHVRGAGVVDYSAVARRLQERLEEAGVAFAFQQEVSGLSLRGREVRLETRTGAFAARFVISCGGLQADRLARLGGNCDDVQIVPFRGEYFELRPEARDLVRTLIYPVPDPRFPFLGVHFTRGVAGDVECGPNAVLNLGRETYAKGAVDLDDLVETLSYPGFRRLAQRYPKAGAVELFRSFSKAAFVRAAQRLVPKIRAQDLVRAPAGIRAQAVTREGRLLDDFAFHESPYVLSVVNAPSPAATASLRLGQEVARRALLLRA